MARKFRIFIRGENFYLSSAGVAKRYGFYTTRFVEAEDESSAGEKASNLLRNDERIREHFVSNDSNAPQLFIEEIEELDSFDDTQNLTPGFTFYEDEPSVQ